jgi:hypothetical protein
MVEEAKKAPKLRGIEHCRTNPSMFCMAVPSQTPATPPPRGNKQKGQYCSDTRECSPNYRPDLMCLPDSRTCGVPGGFNIGMNDPEYLELGQACGGFGPACRPPLRCDAGASYVGTCIRLQQSYNGWSNNYNRW